MMTIVQMIAIWLIVPFILFAASEIRVRRLRARLNHDRILYAFCAARDIVALKAIEGELDEKTETFRYFYKSIGSLIHEHKRHPIGFAHLAKMLAQERNEPVPTWKRRLLRELKKADPDIKRVVSAYVAAIELVMKQDVVVAVFEKLPFFWREARGELLRHVSKQPLISTEKRRFARFSSDLARMVDYSPTEFAMAS